MCFAFFNPNDTASYARVYQHDVRAKQTKVCDAERARGPPVDNNYKGGSFHYEKVELQQRVSGSVFTPGTVCRAAMSHPALKIQGGTSRELPAKKISNLFPVN